MTQRLTVRLPNDLMYQVNLMAEEDGCSRTDVVIRALTRFFGHQLIDGASLDSLKEQMDELLRLEKLNYHNIHALDENIQQYRQSTSKPPSKGFG